MSDPWQISPEHVGLHSTGVSLITASRKTNGPKIDVPTSLFGQMGLGRWLHRGLPSIVGFSRSQASSPW